MDAMSTLSTTPTVFSNENTLIFDIDNPWDTTITDSETGEIAYIVSTQTTNRRTHTRFQTADGEVLASSEWQPGVDEDLISMGQMCSVPFRSYFKKTMFKE